MVQCIPTASVSCLLFLQMQRKRDKTITFAFCYHYYISERNQSDLLVSATGASENDANRCQNKCFVYKLNELDELQV